MTRQEQTAKIAQKCEAFLGNLYGRWQDEKEYEDFEEFRMVAEDRIESAGARFDNMTKRPFRVTFYVQNVRCFIKITSREYCWGVMGNHTHH